QNREGLDDRYNGRRDALILAEIPDRSWLFPIQLRDQGSEASMSQPRNGRRRSRSDHPHPDRSAKNLVSSGSLSTPQVRTGWFATIASKNATIISVSLTPGALSTPDETSTPLARVDASA